MAEVNKFGLARRASDPVRRLIRQACGYGCVICGSSIIEYEHIDPLYSEARAHEPDRMALLCPNHHAKVTRGLLSKEVVAAARRDPYCLRQGYASDIFEIGKTLPTLVFGGQKFRCPIPIRIYGQDMIAFSPAEEPGGPFRFSASFFNSKGELSLQVINNEWQALTSNWDVETKGPSIVIRDALGQISLQLKASPPDVLVVERIDMQFREFRFLGNASEWELWRNGTPTIRTIGGFSSGSWVGLAIS